MYLKKLLKALPILALLLLLGNVDNNALSQERRKAQLGLTGGLNTYLKSFLIKDNELSQAENIYFDEGSILKREGQERINSQVDGYIIGLYDYVQPDGDTYAIAYTDQGSLYKMDDYDGTWDMIANKAFTAGARPTFVSFYGETVSGDPNAGTPILIVFNGVDVPQQWEETDDGNDATDEISNLRDYGTGDAPILEQAIVFQSRIFGVGNPTNPNLLYFTDLNDGEDWTTDGSNIAINADDGEFLTALSPYVYSGADITGKLLTFKRDSMFVVDTSDATSSNWTVTQINARVGCWSHWSIKNIGASLVFWDGDNLQKLDGVNTINISVPVTRDFDTINTEERDAVLGTLWEEKDQYWMSLVDSGETRHTTVYVYDYVLNAWTKFTNMHADAMAIIYDDSTETRYLVTGGNQYAYQQWEGNSDETGTGATPSTVAIDASFTTKTFTMEGVEYMKLFQYGYAMLEASGDWDVTWGTATDDSSSFTENTIDLNPEGFILGTGILGVDTLGLEGTLRERFDRDTMCWGIKFKLRNAATGETFKFYGVPYVYQLLRRSTY